jgi:acetone carboxylase gamma subunit
MGSVLGSWTVQQAGGWPMSHHDVTAVLSVFTTNDMTPYPLFLPATMAVLLCQEATRKSNVIECGCSSCFCLAVFNSDQLRKWILKYELEVCGSK